MKDAKAVAISLAALLFLIASFLLDWLFMIPAVFLSYIGWKRLLRKD